LTIDNCRSKRKLKRKITAIKAVRNPRIQRSKIYLDGKFAFSLNNEVILKESLKIDSELSSSELELLTKADQFQSCLNAAFQFLSYRPRSESETRIRLQSRGYEEEEIERVIAQLKRLNLINDADFATYWKENRNSFRPRSQRMLKIELRQKGVEREIINEVVENIDEKDNAYRAAVSKARTIPITDYQIFRQKLGSYLQRRGFSYGVINNVTKQIWQERTDNTVPTANSMEDETV
jgi:regulatory protein